MEEKTLPKLLVNMEVAERKIQERINKGQTFLNRQIDSDDELEIAGKEVNNWSRYNIDLLIRLFDDLSLKDEYQNFHYSKLTFDEIDGMDAMGWGVPDLDYLVVEYKKDMVGSIKSLEGIRDRLELFSELDPPERTFGDKIFIVHGHDETAKHKIARFISDLDLSATILDEQPSRGQTIIDKFEEHADEAGFAIVLLTADDVGASKDRTDGLKPRARQNVIMELGYFLCGLGRDRVRILYEEGVELPSDIYGISYVPMDKRGAWKLDLAQEMASVGITVDMNKLLPNR
jgi:hypothetical protein